MKVKDLLMENYTAYVLDDASRNALAERFPPKYPKFVGHHVTSTFPVSADTPLPVAAPVKVIGYADSGDGIEALVVTVNGQTDRPDGKRYHITWSLDPAKYSAKDSNTLLATNKFTLVRSISVNTTPQLL